VLNIPSSAAMQQNVLEIKVQCACIPVGVICFDPFSGACESH
jgi:hypothetical protein